MQNINSTALLDKIPLRSLSLGDLCSRWLPAGGRPLSPRENVHVSLPPVALKVSLLQSHETVECRARLGRPLALCGMSCECGRERKLQQTGLGSGRWLSDTGRLSQGRFLIATATVSHGSKGGLMTRTGSFTADKWERGCLEICIRLHWTSRCGTQALILKNRTLANKVAAVQLALVFHFWLYQNSTNNSTLAESLVQPLC